MGFEKRIQPTAEDAPRSHSGVFALSAGGLGRFHPASFPPGVGRLPSTAPFVSPV